MSPHTNVDLQPSRAAAATTPRLRACPVCGGSLHHVPRRWIDHLLSLVMPVSRYRCETMSCQWEGNLRGRHLRQPHVGRSYRNEGRGPHL